MHLIPAVECCTGNANDPVIVTVLLYISRHPASIDLFCCCRACHMYLSNTNTCGKPRFYTTRLSGMLTKHKSGIGMYVSAASTCLEKNRKRESQMRTIKFFKGRMCLKHHAQDEISPTQAWCGGGTSGTKQIFLCLVVWAEVAFQL